MFDRLHECLDKLIVLLTTNPTVPPADVVGIVEQQNVVGTYVKANRQTLRWMDPGRCRVQGQFADRDSHPSRPLVAETKDTSIVGRDNEANFPTRRIVQYFRYPANILRRNPGTTRTS